MDDWDADVTHILDQEYRDRYRRRAGDARNPYSVARRLRWWLALSIAINVVLLLWISR